MGLDLWFRKDIARALAAAHEGMVRAGVNDEYRRGFEDALRVLAVNFGAVPPTGSPEHERSMRLGGQQ